MEAYLSFMLIRFAVIAAVVGVIAVVLFAIAVHLKRRGRWEQTRDRVKPMVIKAAKTYAERRSMNRYRR